MGPDKYAFPSPWVGWVEVGTRPREQPLWEAALALSKGECLSSLSEAALPTWERVCWEAGASWSPGWALQQGMEGCVQRCTSALCRPLEPAGGRERGWDVVLSCISWLEVFDFLSLLAVDLCASGVPCLPFLCGQMLGEINSKQLRLHTKFHTVIWDSSAYII